MLRLESWLGGRRHCALDCDLVSGRDCAISLGVVDGDGKFEAECAAGLSDFVWFRVIPAAALG